MSTPVKPVLGIGQARHSRVETMIPAGYRSFGKSLTSDTGRLSFTTRDPGTVELLDPRKISVVRLLGRGGFHDAYEVTYRRYYQEEGEEGGAAIAKICPPELIKQMREEARILSALHHTNIVDFIGFRQLPELPIKDESGTETGEKISAGTFALFEGYVNGGELRDWMREHHPLAECLTIICGSLRGLQAVHDENIIHRDLKPSNIFLEEAEEGGRVKLTPKIAGFGIAKAPKQTTLMEDDRDIRIGTPHYMPPEQFYGRDFTKTQGDLWSMAVILYEMVFARRPYKINELIDEASGIKSRALAPTEALDWWLAQGGQNRIDYSVPTRRETETEFVDQVAEVLKGVLTDKGNIKITSAKQFDEALEGILSKIPS